MGKETTERTDGQPSSSWWPLPDDLSFFWGMFWLPMVLSSPFTEGVEFMALPLMTKAGIATGWAVVLSLTLVCMAATVMYGLVRLALAYTPESWAKTRDALTAARYSALVIPLLWVVLMFYASSMAMAWPVVLGLSCLLPVAVAILYGVSKFLVSMLAPEPVNHAAEGLHKRVSTQLSRHQHVTGKQLGSEVLGNLPAKQCFSLLYMAASHGHPQVVEAITKRRGYKNNVKPENVMRLCYAAIGDRASSGAPDENCISIVRILLDSRDDVTVNSVNHEVEDHSTMLAYARHVNFTAMETFLIERGAEDKTVGTSAAVPAPVQVVSTPPREFMPPRVANFPDGEGVEAGFGKMGPGSPYK